MRNTGTICLFSVFSHLLLLCQVHNRTSTGVIQWHLWYQRREQKFSIPDFHLWRKLQNLWQSSYWRIVTTVLSLLLHGHKQPPPPPPPQKVQMVQSHVAWMFLKRGECHLPQVFFDSLSLLPLSLLNLNKPKILEIVFYSFQGLLILNEVVWSF